VSVRVWYKQPRVYAQAVVSGCRQSTKQMVFEPEDAGVQSCRCSGQIREIQLSEVGTWGEVGGVITGGADVEWCWWWCSRRGHRRKQQRSEK
jgi:hypothetical protein